MSSFAGLCVWSCKALCLVKQGSASGQAGLCVWSSRAPCLVKQGSVCSQAGLTPVGVHAAWTMTVCIVVGLADVATLISWVMALLTARYTHLYHPT